MDDYIAGVVDDSWKKVQKKTFTAWLNVQLKNIATRKIEDIETELCDGVFLIQLMEKLSKTKLGKRYHSNFPKMRFHRLDNMTDVWNFLKRERVKIENIGPEDIVDANLKLILGLIWTLILKYQIENISWASEDEDGHRGNPLLRWCQAQLANYPSLKVNNFGPSFQDGRALCGLLHKHCPQLQQLNPEKLSPNNALDNLQLAFDAAEKHWGVPKILDAHDVAQHPDEKSVMTYVSELYHGVQQPPKNLPEVDEEEERRKREAAEAARKKQEEEDRRRKEEEERKKREEEERKRKEEEERKRKEEEDRKKKEEEEKRKQELLLLQQEEERKRKEKEDQERREQEERDRQAAEKKRQEEEEQKKKQAELLLMQELEKKKQKEAEEERQRQLEKEKQERLARKGANANDKWVADETAGGNPDHETYRNNPQFELYVPEDGPVRVTLCVENRPNPDTKIGFALCKKASPFGVNMPLEDNEVMCNTGYVPADEVSFDVNLKAKDCPYILIPSTFNPNEECKFSIRAVPLQESPNSNNQSGKNGSNASNNPDNKLQLKPLSIPEPYSKKFSFNGEWTNELSGGMHDLPSWRQNPQYMIKVTQPTKIFVVLSQPHHNKYAPLNSISFHVVKNEDDDVTEHVLTAHDVVGFIERIAKNGKTVNYSDDQVEVSKEVLLNYNKPTPVFIVPSCWEQHTTGKFNLTVYADKDISIDFVGGGSDFPYKTSLEGEWTNQTAGGGKGLSTWRNNPTYKIIPTQETRLSLILSRAKINIVTEDGISFMEKKNVGIGFHVVKNKNPAFDDIVLPNCQVVNFTKKYVQQGEVSINMQFSAEDVGKPHFLIPSTYDAGHNIAYVITIYTDAPVKLEPINPRKYHTSTLEGAWIKDKTSGGYQGSKGWRENPQFLLTLNRPTLVGAITKQNAESGKQKSSGLHIARNKDQNATTKLMPMHEIIAEAKEGEYTYFKSAEVALDALLQPGTYFIVPSVFTAGDEGSFAMTIITDSPPVNFQMVDPNTPDAPAGFTASVKSQFKGQTAGGNCNEPTWKNNPQFALTLSGKSNVTILLAQDEDNVKGIGFGLYKSGGSKVSDESALISRFMHDGKFAYVTKGEVSMDVALDAGTYTIVPSTFAKGDETSFSFKVISQNADVKLVAL